ncbi:MAG: transposase [Opitutales bacterium]
MATEKAKPEGSKRRRYTADEKRRVVEDAERLGVCAAAKKHGINQSNVSRWRTRARGSEDGQSTAARGEAVEARSEPKTGGEETRGSPGAEAAREKEARATRAPARRIAKKYTPTQIAEALEYAAAHGVTAAAKKLGMSRFAIHDWRAKAQKAATGEGPSPTSGPAPEDIEAQRDGEILAEWKRHPGLGPSQVRNQLRRKGVKVSVRTVRRVMEDAGYRPPRVKRQKHDARFEAVRPNHMWHLDYVHRFINHAHAHTLILLDDCSRFVTGHGVSDAERADFVIETFEAAIERHGKPEMVLHDKGAAFWSWRGVSRFTAYLTELGIDQVVAEHKEWNGKLEAFNGNLHTELFDVQRFYDLAEMRRRLASHLHWYNHARTHHALGGLLVPADRFYGRTDEVLARIEAGGGRELELDLRDRRLELFKVVTKDGVPEVWLMGHRLFELRD